MRKNAVTCTGIFVDNYFMVCYDKTCVKSNIFYAARSLIIVRAGNRSLMDRTPDSDSGNAGSIPAGCILTVR